MGFTVQRVASVNTLVKLFLLTRPVPMAQRRAGFTVTGGH
jgi:hypothetical protein